MGDPFAYDLFAYFKFEILAQTRFCLSKLNHRSDRKKQDLTLGHALKAHAKLVLCPWNFPPGISPRLGEVQRCNCSRLTVSPFDELQLRHAKRKLLISSASLGNFDLGLK